MATTPLLDLKNLSKRFDISGGLLDQLRFQGGRLTRRKTVVHAVNNVSFSINEGETLSVVGESGCGKSTLARTVIGLYRPNAGEIIYRGQRIDNLSEKAALPYRTRMQMVFQDPYASLNPRMRVRQILEEPVRFHNPAMTGAEVRERVAGVMDQVGINPAWADRYPHEFSGGQRQRISIARALVVKPEFIVADEPISALDVSIQAQVLNLLMDLQEEFGLTYLFISHDLSVVEHISNRVAVMYLGKIVERAPVRELFRHPCHPYTQGLLNSVPVLGKKGKKILVPIEGMVPSPTSVPPGCSFYDRCPRRKTSCNEVLPLLKEVSSEHWVRCNDP